MSQMPESEKLHLFVERCQELVDTRIWREGGLSLRLEVGKQLQEPDVDNLRSFLTVFRQFTARQPVFFETITEIAKEHLTADYANEAAHSTPIARSGRMHSSTVPSISQFTTNSFRLDTSLKSTLMGSISITMCPTAQN